MKRALFLAVLVTVILLTAACEPVLLLPAEAPEARELEITQPAGAEINTIAFDGTVYQVSEEAWGIAVDDLNGDGLPDLAVSDAASGGIGVFLNPGNGAFAKGTFLATGEAPNSVTTVDMDDDGDLDLAVANGGSDTLSLLVNDGQGGFESGADLKTGVMPWWVVTADMNLDALPDLVFVHDLETAGVILGQGEGRFQPMTEHLVAEESVTGSVSVVDVNGDGLPDMVTRLWPEPIFTVVINNGDGSYADPVEYALDGEPHGAYPMDLNGDGAVDLAVVTGGDDEPGLLSVLFNAGDGVFLPPVAYETGDFPLDVAPLDLDGDADLDLLVTDCGAGTVSVFNNDGNGGLARTAAIAMPTCPVEIVVVDLDGTAGLEMLTSSFDGTVMVMTLPDGLTQK